MAKVMKNKNAVSTDNTGKAKRPEYGVGRRMALGFVVAAGLVLGCGTWVAKATISGAVIATGQVTVERHLKRVQHRDGGIVKSILVDDGDRVQAGDVLIELDAADTQTELSILTTEMDQVTARRLRVAAEVENIGPEMFAQRMAQPKDTNRDALEAEQRIFLANLAMRDGQKDQLRVQIDQIGAELAGLQAQDEAKGRELDLAKGDLDRLRSLYEKKLIEVARVNAAERDVARIVGERGSIESAIARATQKKGEIELQIIGLDQSMRVQAQEDLSTLESRASELQQRIAQARDKLSRMVIRAPETGFVNELAIHTIGGIISPAQVILSIVPVEEKLAVEVNFAPTDIDQLYIGQQVRLRFAAFNQRTTPEITGTLTHLAAAASSDGTKGMKWYAGKVNFGDDISKLGDQKLVPGMPVEVLVTTAERTVLSYLAKPIADQLEKTFKEE